MSIIQARDAKPGTVYAFKQGPYDISNVVEITAVSIFRDEAVEVVGRWLLVGKSGEVYGDPIVGEGSFDLDQRLTEVPLYQAPHIRAALFANCSSCITLQTRCSFHAPTFVPAT